MSPGQFAPFAMNPHMQMQNVNPPAALHVPTASGAPTLQSSSVVHGGEQ